MWAKRLFIYSGFYSVLHGSIARTDWDSRNLQKALEQCQQEPGFEYLYNNKKHYQHFVGASAASNPG